MARNLYAMRWNSVLTPGIDKIPIDTKIPETVVDYRELSIYGIDIDKERQELYLCETGDNCIAKCNIDGSAYQHVISVVSGTNSCHDLIINEVLNVVYWSNEVDSPSLHKCDMDGSNHVVLFDGTASGMNYFRGIAIDWDNEKIYFTVSGGTSDRGVYRCNLDGSNVEFLVADDRRPEGIALDVNNGYMYWASLQDNVIYRSNLDGTDKLLNVTVGLNGPIDVELDIDNEYIYWCESLGDKICRSSMSGTNIETLVGPDHLNEPVRIRLDLSENKIYYFDRRLTTPYTSEAGFALRKCDLDGSNKEQLLSYQLGWHQYCDVDYNNGNIYWTDYYTHEVKYAPLAMASGATIKYRSDIKVLANGNDGLIWPWGITVDYRDETIYFTDRTTNCIYKVNKDETGLTVIVSGLSLPEDICLDVYNDKLYFCEYSPNRVKRCNTDGICIRVL